MTERLRLEIPVADLQLGIMIEVPSAALLAPVLAKEVDLFQRSAPESTRPSTPRPSTGHPTLSAQADGLYPGSAATGSTSSCAPMPRYYSVRVRRAGGRSAGGAGTIGLGVDELSVSARSIPEVKARVRELSMERLKTLATQALSVGSPDEVRLGGGALMARIPDRHLTSARLDRTPGASAPGRSQSQSGSAGPCRGQAAWNGGSCTRADLGQGHTVTVSGFLGEDNQSAFNALFASRGFADAFIRVPGETRSNINWPKMMAA